MVRRLADHLVSNFRLLSICFSVVHGSITVMLLYATSLLPGTCGSYGNGIFYITSVFSSLMLSMPAVMLLGRKGCLVIGLGLYTIYVGLFTLALLFKKNGEEGCNNASSYLFWLGSLLAGSGAGLLWTAQGSFFAHTTALLSQGDVQEQSSSLAGTFAFIYLAGEFLLKATYSAVEASFPSVGYASLTAALFAACLLGLGAAFSLDPLSEDQTTSKNEGEVFQRTADKIWETASLMGSPLIWHLAPLNLAFGFGSAYLNGSFNEFIASVEVGTDLLGAFGALTVLTATLSSQAYSDFGKRFGNGVAMAVGSLAMMSMAIFGSTQCNGWGDGIAVVYIAWGLGRGCYESTNRAVVVNAYLPEDRDAAFANFTFQQCMAASIAYFLNSTKLSLLATAGFAAAAPLTYLLAKRWFPIDAQTHDEESERMNLLARAPGRQVS